MQNRFPLTMEIPTNIRDLQLLYFMRPFTTDVMNTRLRINPPFSALYIQKNVPYQTKKLMHPEDARMLGFQMTQANMSGVKYVFSCVESWLKPEIEKELYGTNDEGKLMFNMDYRSLKATYAEQGGALKHALQAVPSLIDVGMDKSAPGVILFINKSDNYITLNKSQAARLVEFFKDFSFVAYDQYLMTCYNYCMTTGNVITREQADAIAKQQMQMNSNFRTY